MRRPLAVLLPVLLVLPLGCAGGETGSTPAPSRAGDGSSAPASSSPATADDVVEVSVSVRDGKVRPPARRVRVEEGSRVRIVVTSDVDDQVHVHGYDAEGDLEAGRSTTVELVADQAGVFEVETHEGGLALVQLEVR